LLPLRRESLGRALLGTPKPGLHLSVSGTVGRISRQHAACRSGFCGVNRHSWPVSAVTFPPNFRAGPVPLGYLRHAWLTRPLPSSGLAQHPLNRAASKTLVPMSEHQKQSAFLKALMTYEDSVENRLLNERLSTAERNERCILYACRLVGVLAALGLGGLGYSAVLLPEFFDNSPHILIQFFSALGLGSTMCLAVFSGLWFWYRIAVNRVYVECRRVVMRMVESRFKTSSTTFYPMILNGNGSTVQSSEFSSTLGTTEFVNLRKAS
jgi:hypothetical protein